MKVGDKIEILKDNLQNADVRCGDILTITQVDEHSLCTEAWGFNKYEQGDGFRLLPIETLYSTTDAGSELFLEFFQLAERVKKLGFKITVRRIT